MSYVILRLDPQDVDDPGLIGWNPKIPRLLVWFLFQWDEEGAITHIRLLGILNLWDDEGGTAGITTGVTCMLGTKYHRHENLAAQISTVCVTILKWFGGAGGGGGHS